MKKFPADLKVYRSVLLSAPALVEKSEGSPAVTRVDELVVIESSRDTLLITMRVGNTLLTVGAANAMGLAKALADHVQHLGEKAEYVMTNDSVTEGSN